METTPSKLILTPERLRRIETPRGRQYLVILVLLLGDLVSFALAFGLATQIRVWLVPLIGGVIPPPDIFFPLLQLNLISILITYTLMGLYPGFGLTAVEELRHIFNALTLGYGLLGMAVYLQKAGVDFPRSVFLMGWAFAFLFNTAMRFAIRNRASLLKWWGTPVIVVGREKDSQDVIERLQHSRRMGLRPILLLDENIQLDEDTQAEDKKVLGIPVIQSPEVLQDLVARCHLRLAVFVESPEDTRLQVRERLGYLNKIFPTVLVVLADSPLGSLWVRTMDLEGRLTLSAQYHLLDWRATLSKRLFDLGLSLLVAVITAPLLLLIALLIKLESPGPVLYCQDRLGLGGRRIRYLKFRTMAIDADQRLQELLQTDPKANQEYQQYHKLARDPRITRVGRFLRKFSLDELPQIWHVLSGEMSWVGPRAYMPSELPDMGSHADLILQIKPGLTGWWQVMGRNATTFRQRLELDEYYISNWSLWLDIYIMLKTVWVIATGSGA